MIIWLTGQPGAGKTVLAQELYFQQKIDYIVDGDDLRKITNNKNYGIEGRVQNVSTAQKIALYLNNKGEDVVVALVSPYLDQREEFKELVGDDLKEVYLHTTEERGKEHFHVKSYQPPQNNYLDLDTTEDSIEESFNKILEYVR